MVQRNLPIRGHHPRGIDLGHEPHPPVTVYGRSSRTYPPTNSLHNCLLKCCSQHRLTSQLLTKITLSAPTPPSTRAPTTASPRRATSPTRPRTGVTEACAPVCDQLPSHVFTTLAFKISISPSFSSSHSIPTPPRRRRLVRPGQHGDRELRARAGNPGPLRTAMALRLRGKRSGDA